ncbi:hypothetical protein N9917_04415 [Deltaproteobacteria bacterium]|nr:hypothetical protein [Deltaproteobacteria bacterium]
MPTERQTCKHPDCHRVWRPGFLAPPKPPEWCEEHKPPEPGDPGYIDPADPDNWAYTDT